MRIRLAPNRARVAGVMASGHSSSDSRKAASTVTDTEEGRAFFQTRLAIFGLAIFVLAGGSWVIRSITTAIDGTQALLSPSSLLHLANALLAGVLWVATRRGRVPGPVLHAFDVGVSLGLILIWGLSSTALPDPTVGGFVALLSFVVGVLARAIVVPSTARRTLVIGLVGAAIIATFAFLRTEPTSMDIGVVATANWSISAVAIATLASHTIFGLRREAAKARVLGQYTLEAKIGEGGMGAVWRASHALLRRPTAIKLLSPGRESETAIRRFEREVQLTARLTHPNTVAIYDYGRTRDGIFYYAMELLDGTDLERLVAQHGPQPPERVVHVLSQVCGALAEAHDLGLVHRDVKPANILLSPRNHEHEFAKVVDFGLVKTIETSSELTALSATNMITGTPLYMSPEAIQAPNAVDGRSDLYALGAVAWFLLVGRPVFEGSLVTVCGHHLHTEPQRPSQAVGAAIPPELEEVVLACLAKRPGSRPADARALRAKLEATGLASAWTMERAAEWWRTRGQSEAPPEALTGPHTIALDVANRAASAEG
jgi:eukaryotic-like serine/threonine-protein kinase